MTKHEFYNGVMFDLGDGYEYQYREPMTDFNRMGSLRRRCTVGIQEWQYCGAIQIANDRGVRVYEYWCGKRVSRFLFFKQLHPQPAKDLAKN